MQRCEKVFGHLMTSCICNVQSQVLLSALYSAVQNIYPHAAHAGALQLGPRDFSNIAQPQTCCFLYFPMTKQTKISGKDVLTIIKIEYVCTGYFAQRFWDGNFKYVISFVICILLFFLICSLLCSFRSSGDSIAPAEGSVTPCNLLITHTVRTWGLLRNGESVLKEPNDPGEPRPNISSKTKTDDGRQLRATATTRNAADWSKWPQSVFF